MRIFKRGAWMKGAVLAALLLLAVAPQAQARIDRATTSASDPLTSLNVQVTTAATAGTAADNMTALAADAVAAMGSGETLYVPAGSYPYGTSSQTVVALTADLNIECQPGAKFNVANTASTTIPLLFTTEALWVDTTVTAIATATSGGELSTESETTKLTFAAPPAVSRGDMVSIYSNDILGYNDGDSANFPHEIATVHSVSGNDVYLTRKLNRTYTTTNLVKMRDYNNNFRVKMKGCTFTVDGDPYDSAVTVRPAAAFEVRGVREFVSEDTYFDEIWAGGGRLNSTMFYDIRGGGSKIAPNMLSGLTFYAYIWGKDGPNYAGRVTGGDYKEGRHITSIFLEESSMTFSGAATVGATTVFTFAADSSDTNPAVNDLVYIEGVSSTLGAAINGTWQTITARTGSAAAGGTITVSFDSTGLAGSGGTGQLFEPDQVHRYGEDDSALIDAVTGFANLGNLCDSHNGTINGMCRDLRILSPNEKYGSINPRSAQFRGVGEMLLESYQEWGTQLVNIYSFQQNHGVSNHPIIRNMIVRGQQDRTAAQTMILTSGDAAVTDERLLYVDGYIQDGSFYEVIEHAANAGDLYANNLMLSGDFGTSGSPSSRALRSQGGVFIVKDSIIDLCDTTTTEEVRIALLEAGTMIWQNNIVRCIGAASNYPFTLSTAASTIMMIGNTFEFDSAATDNTVRFLTVSNVTATVDIARNKFVNAAKMDTAQGVVRSSGASAVANIYTQGNEFDAAYVWATTGSGGAATVIDRTRNPLAVHAAGTVYALTATPAALDFGTTDPAITLNVPGTYRLTATVQLDYNAATFAASRNATLKLRRTNNTAADLTSGARVVKTEIVTTTTSTLANVTLVVDYTTSNSDDAIALFGDVSAVPTAGSLDVAAASIHAIKLY